MPFLRISANQLYDVGDGCKTLVLQEGMGGIIDIWRDSSPPTVGGGALRIKVEDVTTLIAVLEGFLEMDKSIREAR